MGKKKKLKEVVDVSKVMISLKSTYKIQPQKLHLNGVYLLENYKVLHHRVIQCESVVFENQSVLPKNYKHVFIAQVKGAVFYHLAILCLKWSKVYKMCQRVLHP